MAPRAAPAAVLVALAVAGTSAARADEPAPPRSGTVNAQRPLHLLWSVTGDFATPGGLGVRAAVHGWTPTLPIYVGGQALRYWGVSPSHLGGERDNFLTRYFTGYAGWEVRAGLSLASWSQEQLDAKYSFDTQYRGDVVTWKQATYRPVLPVYRRRTLYAGYRARSVPGHETCPDVPLAMLPEDCAELDGGLAMIGYSSLRAVNATFDTTSHGRLRLNNYRHVDLRITYAGGNAYARDSVGTRIGAEILFTYGRGAFVVAWGVGWDGQLALITMALGGGGARSFGGASPP